MKTTCLYCEQEYETKRDSSTYCSNSCRTGHYKLRKKNAQIEAERLIAVKDQKEKDNKQKLIEDELRNQKAEKRRQKKANKALKASQENEKIITGNLHVQEYIHEPELPPEDLNIQPEKHEKLADLPRIPHVLTVKQRLDLIKKSNSGSTNITGFWDVVKDIAKIYIDNKNKK